MWQFPRLWTEEHAQELLQWFSEAFAPGRGGSGRRWGDTGGRGSAGGAELRLPASFTKEERKVRGGPTRMQHGTCHMQAV